MWGRWRELYGVNVVATNLNRKWTIQQLMFSYCPGTNASPFSLLKRNNTFLSGVILVESTTINQEMNGA